VVTWPSGTVQTVSEGLGINRRIEITEPAEEADGSGSADKSVDKSTKESS
jgi:hypothetical protein